MTTQQIRQMLVPIGDVTRAPKSELAKPLPSPRRRLPAEETSA